VTGAGEPRLRQAEATGATRSNDREEPTLVDAVEPDYPPGLLTNDEAGDLERMRRADADAQAVNSVATLTVNPINLARAHQVRAAFEQAADDSSVGELLLCELVAGETATALELQDVEAGLVSLLGRTITDPSIALAVTKTLREVVGVSNVIRLRMERALGAAENMKAQRRFLHAQRGRVGV